MKKKYFLFILIFSLFFIINACVESATENTVLEETTIEETNEEDEPTTQTLEMYNERLEGISDYTLDVTDALSIGIKTNVQAIEQSTLKDNSNIFRKLSNNNSIILYDDFNETIRNYLVKTIGDNDSYININFTIGETVVSQEDLQIDVSKLLVVGDFTFIQFADVTTEIYYYEDPSIYSDYGEFGIKDYCRMNYYTDFVYTSFVINNTTGKIYQIPHYTEGFSINEIKNNIITGNDGLLYNFYINDYDELVFESLFTNADIEVQNYAKDIQGNCYILTSNFSFVDEENHVVYIKNDLYEELFLSDKGNVWVRQASGNDMLFFESFNQTRQINEYDNDLLLRLDSNYSHNFVFINNLNAHFLCADSSGILIEELTNCLHFSLRGYGEFYYFDFFNDNKILFNDYTNKQLVIFDFSSFMENLTYSQHYEISTTDDLYQFFDEEDTEIFLTDFNYSGEQITPINGVGITFEAIGLDGTDTYLVYLEDGVPTKVLYSVYDAPDKNIVTLQPIN